MKNLYLINTNDPSNLTIRCNTNNLMFSYNKFVSQQSGGGELNKNQHVYVTGDEEVEEGDWYIRIIGYNPLKADKNYVLYRGDEKIIMTTDQNLIQDGIQSVDDEFLLHLCNNPNCEKVKIHSVYLCTNCGQQYCDNSKCSGYEDKKTYLISIPENIVKKIVTYCDGHEVNEEEFFSKEKSYSEEEVLNILFEATCNNEADKEEMKEWFKQFSKLSN